jgi:CubicO group peptidase (beta-lactamase class C family)
VASPAPPASSAAPSPPNSPVDAIFAQVAEGVRPGCAVGVYRAGSIVFEKGYGYASLELGDRIDASTRFQVASVTKQFTAASILLLAGEGKLAVADDVRKFLPELPSYGAPITIDHLLHHTSGIRNAYTLLSLEGHDSLADLVTPEEALYLLFHQRGVNWAPGVRYDYMAGNYWLLAEIVRRVSGETLAAFAKHRIFEPLGMIDTIMKDDHEALIPRAASGYQDGQGTGPASYKASSINMEVVGGIGVVTTVRDLAKWDANFYEPKVGGQAMIDGLRVHVMLNDGTVLPEARGLSIEDVGGVTRESYRGITTGFDAFVARYPKERLGVAVLCNDTNLDTVTFSDRVASLYLPKSPPASDPVQGAAQAAAPLGPIDPTIPGVYIDRASAVLRTFTVKDGRLFISGDLDGKGGRALEQASGSEFVAGGVAHYAFHPPNGGNPAFALRTMKGEPTSTFDRQERVGPLGAEALRAYDGRYASDEIPRDWEVVVQDGKLLSRPLGGRTPPDGLIPVTRDRFRRGDEQWTFVRDARGRVTGFVYDSAPDALGIRYVRVGPSIPKRM